MNFSKIITARKIIGRADEKNSVHIAFGIDKFYIPMMGILITSLIINNSARKFIFHVFLDRIDAQDFEKLSELCKLSEVQINIYQVAPELFRNFYFEKGYSIAIFYRIIAADFLADSVENLIYMDSDMICLKSIEEFLKFAPKNILMSAVEDSGKWIPQHKKNLKLRDGYKYFNTGILYLNLKLWREKKISEQALNFLAQDKYLFPDQDALNLVVERNDFEINYISDKFNYFFRVDGVEQKLRDDVVILHYAGQLKPWHAWCESDLKKIYESYQEKSAWKDFKYLPRNYQENRLMGRALRREGKFFEAFKWYWLYAKDKIAVKISKL